MLFARKGLAWLAVAALCLAAFLQGLLASRRKSPTGDEPQHIMAGASYIATRKIIANPRHPPLLKELAGLSLGWPGSAGETYSCAAGEPARRLGMVRRQQVSA